MYKKIIGIAFSCILLFPITVLAANEVPKEVEQSIEKDLGNFKDDIRKNTGFKITTTKEAENLTLDEGFKVYTVNSKAVRSGNTDRANDILKSKGYLFSIKSGQQNNGIVFSEDGKRIRSAYSDLEFPSQFEEAKKLIGYDESSKLIYDDRLATVALISDIDGKEVVVPLRESVYMEFKPLKVYNLQEFVEFLSANEKARQEASEKNDSDELISGGSPSNLNSTTSQLITSKISTEKVSLFSIAGLAIIGGIFFVIKRRKKL
ncbi:LPXTG cell wall anchor domain-containing protein [Paenibacillus sp. FSL M8-0228]|uniref:LPXTG cell wall anchor domain-containing protein n=1 Tax=Paenibacillus TaxID=44249 RepID=UPI000B078F74|nr:LPXTG cell wall anchor domain-containing protein [Paenibacillus polymyxa]